MIYLTSALASLPLVSGWLGDTRWHRATGTLPSRIRDAVAADDQEAVSAWLSRRRDVDARHHLHGETMLMIASSRGLASMVSMLLRAGADVNCKTTEAVDESGRCFSALMAAIVSGHESVARLLLDAGARVDGINEVLQIARIDGMISASQHARLFACCSCCPPSCACCADGCICKRPALMGCGPVWS